MKKVLSGILSICPVAFAVLAVTSTASFAQMPTYRFHPGWHNRPGLDRSQGRGRDLVQEREDEWYERRAERNERRQKRQELKERRGVVAPYLFSEFKSNIEAYSKSEQTKNSTVIFSNIFLDQDHRVGVSEDQSHAFCEVLGYAGAVPGSASFVKANLAVRKSNGEVALPPNEVLASIECINPYRL